VKKLSPRSPVAVIGLGRVGRTVAQYLLHKRISVYAYDDNDKSFYQKPNSSLLNNSKFMKMRGFHWPILNKKPQLAICSPGLSEHSEIVKFLRHNSIPIIDEIEFTAQILNRPIIAITGTNGKSTTTTLLGKMLDADGKNVFWGGNLAPGLPFAMTLMQELKDIYVIEVSSFQLERSSKFHPNIAVLLNITADHLDRHASLFEYRKIKFKVFENQNKNDYAVINQDDDTIMKYHNVIHSRIRYFSKQNKTNGAYVINNSIYFTNDKICSINKIRLFGSQYLGSILAAITVAKILKVKNHIISNVLSNFTGLEHRLEFVAEYNGVKYLNNSMCTNPDAGAASLNSFNQPVILIAGGKEKKLDVTCYIQSITQKAKFTILIGDNSKRLSELLQKHNYQNFRIADSLQCAVDIAKKYATQDDFVLFSPGFASFDKFANFQQRGTAFKEYVYELK
jgi:UDP-N-acetylmuramoylalanine--D-glutamate ligase